MTACCACSHETHTMPVTYMPIMRLLRMPSSSACSHPCTQFSHLPFAHAQILLLDEATSALDTQSERIVQVSAPSLCSLPPCSWFPCLVLLCWLVLPLHSFRKQGVV